MLMGSKKSVLKNNQTDKNVKKTIKNVFTKIKRVIKQNIPDKPLLSENEKTHKKDGSFSKSLVELQDNSITPVYRIKDSKTGNRKACDHLYSETVYGDEIINYLKEQSEKQCVSKICSKINTADKTNSQTIQISEPSRRKNHRTVLTYDRDAAERTCSLPYSCENDLSDIDVDQPNQFNLDDEFCYLIGDNFSIYQHPLAECLTLTLSEEILNYMEKNQRFVTDDEVGGPAKKDIVESWFENSNTKMINRYDLLDKACSTNPASDFIGPNSLNVAFVKGMIYRRELYGPPIELAGQAGPSRPQVPLGTEEYVITKQYNYGRDDPQTSMPTMNKGFGCTCVQSWSNNFGLCPTTSLNHLPLPSQPPMKLDYIENDIEPEKKDKPKIKLKLPEKKNKKMGPAKKPAVKKVISKKGNAKKRAPSAKPKSPASRKTNSTKPAGKRAKKERKAVKNQMARRMSSRLSLLPTESTESLPPIMENWKQSEKVSNNMIFGKNKPPAVRLSRISLTENLPTKKTSSIMFIRKDANTVKKQAKKNSSRRKKSSLESDDGEVPSTSKLRFKTKVKQDVNADNSNKKKILEKEGTSNNIRIGVSRPDDSGYDIMFSDKGDMKVTVEQVVSGKNRVFTYNSGNEAAMPAVKGIEEDPREAKTAKTGPYQKISKSPGMENSKSQTKKPTKIGVKIPKPLDKPKKTTKGRSTDSSIKKSSFLVPNAPTESSFVHPSALAAHTDKDDAANKRDHKRKDTNISFDEHLKPHHDSEVRKLTPSMVQQSLHPILERFHPSDAGSHEEPNYTAEVQTDKCIIEGNKIECLTSIPHVKVVFDIPGTHGNKIETHTTKSRIVSSLNDIHVDVGLDRIGPKFLDSISQKGVRYDSLVPNENVFTKDSQFPFRKIESLDDGGHKIHPRVPLYMQSRVSLHSAESNVINTDLSDKKHQQNEQNKFKSKLYDANTLFEIKECLSKMKLELRNECPCMASRFQDRLDNNDKNVRTDRVIIIRTKRRDGSQCSDDSDSSYDKETTDHLEKLANEMLERNQKSKKSIINKEDVQNNEEKDEEQETNLDAEKYESEQVEEDNKKKLRKQYERHKSVRGTDDEALNHPEVRDQANKPNDENPFHVNRRRRKTLSNEMARSVLSHPESTVTENEALMTRTTRKSALASSKNTQIEDSHVGFKNVSPETEEEEEKLALRPRSPTGIYFQGQNLLKETTTVDYSSSSINDETDNSKIEVSEPGAMYETIERNEELDEREAPTSMQEKYIDQPESLEKDHSNSPVLNHSPLREKNEKESTLGYKEPVKNMTHDGHVNFMDVKRSPSNSIHERPSIRPRSSTGIYYEGQNLLKANISDEDTLSQNYEEDCEENNMSELDTKNEFRSKEEGYKDGVEPSSASDTDVYKTINVEHIVNFSSISLSLNGRGPVRDISNGISKEKLSHNKRDSGIIKSDGAYKQLDGGEEGHKKTSKRESEKSIKLNENHRKKADVEHELLTDRRRSFREDCDDSLNNPKLSDRSFRISGQNVEEAYQEDKGRRKRLYREESGRPISDHPDSSITENDALMTKTIRKGSDTKKLSIENKIKDNVRIGLRKVDNSSPESKNDRSSFQTRTPTVLYREDGIKNKMNEHGSTKEKSRIKDEYDKRLKPSSVPHKNAYQNINVESSEDLIDGSNTGRLAQRVRDDANQKKYETGSSKKQSDEAKGGSTVTQPKIVTKRDSTMANTARKSSFDRNTLDGNVSSDGGQVVYKSSRNSHFMSNGDRSSIRTTSSTRIFYDEQDLLKGTFVNEDSSSQMYELDNNDKTLARKEEPSAVPHEDVTENLSNRSYTESEEAGSTEKPSEEEDHPEINQPDSPVVDTGTSVTGLIKDTDSDHRDELSLPVENRRVTDRSAGNSISASIGDRSSIRTTNSTRVFYDEPNLSKGPFVNEDSTSQMYEMGSSENKMYGRGVKKEQLLRKIGYDKSLKPPSVRDKDVHQTRMNKNQSEAKGREKIILPKGTVTKHGALMMKNIKETTFDYKVEDKNKPNDDGYFDFKYVGVNSQTKPNEDRTSIRTASSARDFYDEQKLSKGKIAEEVEDMPSHTNEEECDKYVSEPGTSNEIVYRKEENGKGLKPSSVHHTGVPKTIIEEASENVSKVSLKPSSVHRTGVPKTIIEEASENVSKVSLKPSSVHRTGVPKTIIEEASENVSKVSLTRSGGQPKDYANRTPNEQSSREKQDSARSSISDEAYQSSGRQYKSKIRETERKKENRTKREFSSPPGVAMRCCCGTVCPPRGADLQQRRSSSRSWDK